MTFIADEIKINQNFGRGVDHVAAGGRKEAAAGGVVEVKWYNVVSDEITPLFTIYISPEWIKIAGRTAIIETLKTHLQYHPAIMLNFEGFLP